MRSSFSCACKVHTGRDPFGSLRNDVESLARSWSQYASYLNEKNKQMKIAHDQLQPIRDVGDHFTFVFLPVSDTALITFQPLEQALQARVLSIGTNGRICTMNPPRGTST